VGRNPYSKQIGQWHGLVACGPGLTSYTTSFSSNPISVTEWQCVELSERYLYQRFGLPQQPANGYQVVDAYWAYISKFPGAAPLTRVYPGNGRLPQPGDVVSYSDGGNGHTNVVIAVSPPYYSTIDQNFTAAMASNYWTATGHGIDTIVDWLHVTNAAWGGVGTTSQSANRGNTLFAGQYLSPGQYLVSTDVRSALIMQADGNLVDYALGGQVLWQSHTANRPIKFAVMQSDGNFVIYFTDGSIPWSAATSTPIWYKGGTNITLQNDGNLVMYNSASPPAATWATSWDYGTTIAANVYYRGTDRLSAGGIVWLNYFLRSPDGRYALLLQGDGNLVLYSPGYHVLWFSATTGKSVRYGAMGSDGIFRLVDKYGDVVWSSPNSACCGTHTIIQTDGNLVIYQADNTTAVWNTVTGQRI
jgi:hypothetical protein